jgi:hypothetical protein
MFSSDLQIDADYNLDTGWEIVLRLDADSSEGIWSNISDALLPNIVGLPIATVLIAERDQKAVV